MGEKHKWKWWVQTGSHSAVFCLDCCCGTLGFVFIPVFLFVILQFWIGLYDGWYSPSNCDRAKHNIEYVLPAHQVGCFITR